MSHTGILFTMIYGKQRGLECYLDVVFKLLL
jgi:hypothetical protein